MTFIIDAILKINPTAQVSISDNDINDFTGLYKELHNAYSTPEATIIIEEYLFHSTTIADKEICFMGCVAKLLNI